MVKFASGLPTIIVVTLLVSGLGAMVFMRGGLHNTTSVASTTMLTIEADQSTTSDSGAKPSGEAPGGQAGAAASAADCTDGGPKPVPARFLVPSKESYEKMQANPDLVKARPELLKEFEAAPWLLPPRNLQLPHSGVTDLDQLLELRAQPVPGYDGKAISFTLSTLHDSPATSMAQNYLNGLVKMAGVTNYIMAVWTDAALATCTELNLPCADVRRVLAGRQVTEAALENGNIITWIKPILAEYVLAKGYAFHVSDTDVGYAAKPLWKSYMTILSDPPSDGAFQNEEVGMGPINTGNFVMLPTPGGKSFIEAWLHGLARGIQENFNDQIWIVAHMPRDDVFRLCRNRQQCYRIRDEAGKENRTVALPTLRTYQSPYHAYSSHDFCAMDQPWAPSLDPCDWQFLYLHVCCPSWDRKLVLLKEQNLWFLADKGGMCPPVPGVNSTERPGAVACTPLVWEQPKYELPLVRCAADLALYHERPKEWSRRLLGQAGR